MPEEHINATDNQGKTALYHAVHKGSPEIINAFMTNGHTDVDKGDSQGFTPLMIAAHSKNVDAVKMLLAHGADPDKPSVGGFSAVTLAEGAGEGNEAVLELLQRSSPPPYSPT